MSRLANTFTFLGYYKVTPVGIFNVLGRSTVEIPPVKVTKGAPTVITAADLAADIAVIVSNNELKPVTIPNEDLETEVFGYLTASQSDAGESGKSNSAKFGLMVPNSGPNKDKGVLVITYKVAGVKNIVEIPIEASGE